MGKGCGKGWGKGWGKGEGKKKGKKKSGKVNAAARESMADVSNSGGACATHRPREPASALLPQPPVLPAEPRLSFGQERVEGGGGTARGPACAGGVSVCAGVGLASRCGWRLF